MKISDHISNAITDNEIEIADKTVEMALEAGASAVEITLDKTRTEIYALLDGEPDNIKQSIDRSLSIRLYADGKFGVFSTNNLNEENLRSFLKTAVENVRFLAKDPYRKLPDPADIATDAVDGDEMELCWLDFDSAESEDKLETARKVSVYGKYSSEADDRNWKVVSEEIEYSNTLSDTYLTSSDHIHCRHTETSFEICSQATVEDSNGEKYSGFSWDYSVDQSAIRISECGEKAVIQAVRKIAPKAVLGGQYTMIVSNKVSRKVLEPVLSALGGHSIQQKSSFLQDSLGKKIFNGALTIEDRPLEKGKYGSILFENDGRACKNRMIIENGIVKQYFINVYNSGKLGLPPTSACAQRPVVKAFAEGQYAAIAAGDINEDNIVAQCGKGILVTDFNGGNCNKSTGEFSYGIEGFLVENGKISHPVSNMLITGDMTTLWNNIEAAGDDPVQGYTRQVPTLVFKDVSFSA